MNQIFWVATLVVMSMIPCFVASANPEENAVIDIGSWLELMVDEYLIETMSTGARLQIHQPTKREVAIVTDKPREGNACTYWSILQTGDIYWAYYGCQQYDPIRLLPCAIRPRHC